MPSTAFIGSRFSSLLSITTTSFSSEESSLATLPPIEPPPQYDYFQINKSPCEIISLFELKKSFDPITFLPGNFTDVNATTPSLQ